MEILPALRPEWFPPVAGGPDASRMWLGAMGTVNLVVGAALVVRRYLVPALARAVEAGRTAAAARRTEAAPDPAAVRFGLPGR